jgi:hypothetical protein
MAVALADVIAPREQAFRVLARGATWESEEPQRLSEVTNEKRRRIPRDCLLRRDVKWSVALTWLVLALVC